MLSQETRSPGELARLELLAGPERPDWLIAEQAGVGLATVYRARRQLEQAGVISRRWKSRSPVPDIPELPRMPQQLADGLCARWPNPDLWCSDDPADRQAAIRVCWQCPTRLACLQWALSLPSGSVGAVYAGLRPAQLARLRRERERESA